VKCGVNFHCHYDRFSRAHVPKNDSTHVPSHSNKEAQRLRYLRYRKHNIFVVQRAVQDMAVDTLLVSDSLFRAQCVKERRKYVDMVEEARANGASVHIFSTMHESGQFVCA